MLVLNTIFPLFFLLLLGRGLKYSGMTDERFLAMSDRLVYYVFFPARLFWKIGGSGPDQGISAGLCLAGLSGVILAFSASLAAIHGFRPGLSARPLARKSTRTLQKTWSATF